MSTLVQLEKPLRDWLRDAAVLEAALLSVGYQGAVYLFEHDDKAWVLKRAGSGLLTGWLHRYMLRREVEVYKRLDGIEGVPRSLGMFDDEWLVLEFISGESLRDARYSLRDREAFYKKLRKVISDIHAAGIAHGDLKRKENILVTEAEDPFIIDFGTAVRRDGAWFDQLVFNVIARADFNAWIKVKYAKDYSAISAEDQRWYNPGIIERGLRAIRQVWRLVSFRQLRKRRRARRNS